MRKPTEPYGYARLCKSGREIFQKFATGKEIFDLGAGTTGALSELALTCGATHVTAIDPRLTIGGRSNLTVVPRYLQEADLSTAPNLAKARHLILSWPTNSPDCAFADRVEQLVANCETLLYIGQNDRFTVCGWEGLWDILRQREVLASATVKETNTVIYYGQQLDELRQADEILPEERAAFRIFGRRI